MIPLNQNLSTLKRSAIRVYTNLAKEVPGCVMLTIGEPDFDTPEVIKAAAVSALAGGQTHYAPNQGTAALRKAVADYETGRGHADTPEQVPLKVLIPAFMVSELKTAFQMGFMLFLPFLVIDLVTASILMAMGMMMLSPALISLPFKLMLLVLVDGWSLLIGTLVSSFGIGTGG